MTGAKRRIHPFHQKAGWLIRNGVRPAPHDLHALRQVCHQFLRARLNTGCVCDSSNIIEYVRDTCWLEVYHLRRARQGFSEPCNCAVTDRTDVAQFLSENYIRSKLA